MNKVKPLSLNLNAQKKSECYHCGEPCHDDSIHIGEKVFCCQGCKLVYQLLSENDMCDYYELDKAPGVTPKESGFKTKYQYLEDESIRRKLLDFTDGKTATATFFVPSMHCSSCVWLLENLYKLNPIVLSSQVDFLKKEVKVTFQDSPTALREVVELLVSVGYEPQINLDKLQEKIKKSSNRDLYLKIGVAGFCFGNIMLLSLPHYLPSGDTMDASFRTFFTYLSVLLALPVLFYSSSDYFKSALTAWKQRMVNMDVPISIGIVTLFTRSLYEIVSGSGVGYMDSFSGLIFFLLIGKLFEKKTYDALSFERDYKSYFPVSVTRKKNGREETIPLDKLKPGDRIVVRSQELIPADAVLINGRAFIDYSFVTGESAPVEKVSGDLLYAGGRQTGGAIEVDVVKAVDQSYLTRLWNDETFTKNHRSRITSVADHVSRYFTVAVLSVAFGAAGYWLWHGSTSLALNALTSVLIIACPCALALSTPFTLGNTLRIFARNKFYLKNTAAVEGLARITCIVFDKTGTLTASDKHQAVFTALNEKKNELTPRERAMVKAVSFQSTHPLSRIIYASLDGDEKFAVEKFTEIPGLGMEGVVDGIRIRMGSAKYIAPAYDLMNRRSQQFNASLVFLEIGGRLRGYFVLEGTFRAGLKKTIDSLKKRFKIFMVTGDFAAEKEKLVKIFGSEQTLHFEQTPFDKLRLVKSLQKENERVLMIGDGLNDAGALKQSDVGISIAEDVNTFTPASDAILEADRFSWLSRFMRFARYSLRIILISFALSFLYNTIGLSFAVRGTLSPLIAAVLMPISSISVVLFTTGSTTLLAKKMGFLASARQGENE